MADNGKLIVAARGFGLIELMIVLTIMSLTLLVGLPAYGEFFANAKMRNVAEGYVNGIRQAQSLAVQRNANARFRITAQGWEVRDVESDDVLRSEYLFEATAANAPNVEITPDGATEITFSGFGRALKKNPAVPPASSGTAPIGRITIAAAGNPVTKSLGIDISQQGRSVRMCDPSSRFTYSGSTDPLGCPYPW